MRWERLFADLEAQLARASRDELHAEVGERVRAEVARLRLNDRFAAAVGLDVTVAVWGAGRVHGRLAAAAAEWVLVEAAGQPSALVPVDAVMTVAGLPLLARDPGSEGQVAARLGLAHALRGLARDRAPVALTLRDGSALAGTLDRVGADHVDIATHASGEPRRAPSVLGVRVVPFAALAVVRAA